jgi:SH3-like domain-containing protein
MLAAIAGPHPVAAQPGSPSTKAARTTAATSGDVKTTQSKPDAAKPDAAPQANEEDAAPSDEPAEGSGLPVPRFVSLRTEPVNLRSGPGLRYPVEWVYRRRHLPVEVVAEFDTWRRIRDPDGTEGWVHQTMITGRRTGIVRGTQPLQRTDGDDSNPIAILSAGVVINVQRCPANSPFCRVEVNGLQGWLRRDRFWGVYPNEVVE